MELEHPKTVLSTVSVGINSTWKIRVLLNGGMY